MDLEKMSDQELLQEFMALEDSIYNIECYRAYDVVLISAVAEELERRGYTPKTTEKTVWSKEKEVKDGFKR